MTDVEVPAKTYYHQYLQHQDMTPADFKGVTLDDLVVLEQVFSLNVYVYLCQTLHQRLDAFIKKIRQTGNSKSL
jgi:hypothetical protein